MEDGGAMTLLLLRNFESPPNIPCHAKGLNDYVFTSSSFPWIPGIIAAPLWPSHFFSAQDPPLPLRSTDDAGRTRLTTATKTPRKTSSSSSFSEGKRRIEEGRTLRTDAPLGAYREDARVRLPLLTKCEKERWFLHQPLGCALIFFVCDRR